jgi:DNA-binding MarR family transcriptional regulator
MNLQNLPCYCATLRQLARAVTACYDEVLADSGVHVTQFTVLQALKIAPNLQTTELGKLIGIDQTTATRTLALLRKASLVINSKGEDRREKRWHLTAHGEAVFRKVLPKWEAAQALIENRLGRSEAVALKKASFNAASRLIGTSHAA